MSSVVLHPTNGKRYEFASPVTLGDVCDRFLFEVLVFEDSSDGAGLTLSHRDSELRVGTLYNAILKSGYKSMSSLAKTLERREYEIYEIQLDIDDREQCLQAAEARATHLEERLKKCEADLLGAEYLLEREEADKIVIQNEEMVRTRELACAMQKIEELDDVRQRQAAEIQRLKQELTSMKAMCEASEAYVVHANTIRMRTLRSSQQPLRIVDPKRHRIENDRESPLAGQELNVGKKRRIEIKDESQADDLSDTAELDDGEALE